jgi:branched-chain amino acid aminotransferase
LLWTDALSHEFIEESGTMNVIFRSGNTLFTPMLSDSILSGITRDSVLTLAREWGYNVEERRVRVDEVLGMIGNGQLDEAFGAGTAATIAPIRTFHFRGKDYELAPSADWPFSKRLTDHMELLRRGQTDDVHGWNFLIA